MISFGRSSAATTASRGRSTSIRSASYGRSCTSRPYRPGGALGVVRGVPGGGVGERQDAVAGTGRGHVDVEVRERPRGDAQLGVAASVQAADRLLREQLELRPRVHAAVVLRAGMAEVRPAADRRAGEAGQPRVGRVRAGVQHEAVLVGVARLLRDEPVQLAVEVIRGEGGEPRGMLLAERPGLRPQPRMIGHAAAEKVSQLSELPVL